MFILIFFQYILTKKQGFSWQYYRNVLCIKKTFRR